MLTASGRNSWRPSAPTGDTRSRRVLGHMPRIDVDATITALTAFGDAAHEVGEAQWTAYAL